MSFIDHILAKHKFETVAVLILIAIFVVYIATRSVAQQVQAIPACFTVADQESAPPCTQGETVAYGLDVDGIFVGGQGNGGVQDCYCTVAPLSIWDRLGNNPDEGGVLFTTVSDPSVPDGPQILSQDVNLVTSSILFWKVANMLDSGRLGIGTTDPSARLTIGLDGAIRTTEKLLENPDPVDVYWGLGNQQRVILDDDVTINFFNYEPGQTLRLIICKTTGLETVTWGDSNLLWSGNTPPPLTTTADRCDVLTFLATGTAPTKVFGSSVLDFAP